MNRRWQKEGRGRYETLDSIGSLSARLPELVNSISLCDRADLYAVYSALHSKGRRIEVATNQAGGFHYYLAETSEPKASSSKHTGQANASAPSGTGGACTPAQSTEHPTSASTATTAMEEEEAEKGTAAPGAPSAAPDPGDEGPAVLLPPALLSKDGRRVEPVIPVSSKHTGLTMELLQRLFDLGGGLIARHMLLAVVDDDGSVSLLRFFNYIQPPFEGPETLPPAEAGAQDSDPE